MSDSLKNKAISGVFWNSLDKILVFIFGIVLARVLSETDYGYVAALSIFIFIAYTFQDSGFSEALIRKKNASQKDYSTIFYISLIIGIVLYAILFFSMPFISEFYDAPLLTPLARVLFIALLLNSLSVIHNVQLIKSLNYKLLGNINVACNLISYGVAIVLAFMGYGPWALIMQTLVNASARSILLLIFHKWKPSREFSKESLGELFGFGSKLLATNILRSISSNLTPNAMAKYYSLSEAGYYSQANKWYSTATNLLWGSVQNITYPIFSAIDNGERLIRVYRKIMRSLAFISFPFFMGIILIAKPIIVVLLTDKWLMSVPILQILCVGAIFESLNAANQNIVKVKGKSGVLLFFETIKTVLVVGSIICLIFLKANYLYLICAVSFISAVNMFLYSFSISKYIDYNFTKFMKDILPYFVISALCMACSYLFTFIVQNNILLILCQTITFGFLYLGITYWFGSKISREVLEIVLSRVGLKKK